MLEPWLKADLLDYADFVDAKKGGLNSRFFIPNTILIALVRRDEQIVHKIRAIRQGRFRPRFNYYFLRYSTFK